MTHTNGPVPLSSPDYVRRVFEENLFTHLLNREWVLLLGPREHGKTSALLRVRQKLKEAGLRCAFVDLQELPPALSFRGLLEWFAKKVTQSLGHQLGQMPHSQADSLEDWLACAVPMPGTPVAILIDEASSIPDVEIRNSFYGQIRALKTAAAAAATGSLPGLLQFAFAGTFRPETLVDPRNSPFNVCEHIDTDDLDLEKIQTLARIALGRQDVDEIAQAIFDNIGGQPQLAQALLAVAANASGEEIRAIITESERLLVEGNDHLDSIFRMVVRDAALTRIASAATAAGRIDNDPANADFKFLVILGLMRRDQEHLVFRNSLYEKVARRSAQLRPDASQRPGLSSHFYPLEESILSFVVDPEYREICCSAYNGAVVAINARSFRLALVAFGVALEAILVDWMIRRPAGDIAAAIAAAHARDPLNFNHFENRADPSTWRLINLMRVARQLNALRGPLELPEPLRRLRNFVHPVVMKTTYLPESDLVHEAIAAGGLIGAVMRDLQTP
jgi:hypothetical protein